MCADEMCDDSKVFSLSPSLASQSVYALRIMIYLILQQPTDYALVYPGNLYDSQSTVKKAGDYEVSVIVSHDHPC